MNTLAIHKLLNDAVRATANVRYDAVNQQLDLIIDLLKRGTPIDKDKYSLTKINVMLGKEDFLKKMKVYEDKFLLIDELININEEDRNTNQDTPTNNTNQDGTALDTVAEEEGDDAEQEEPVDETLPDKPCATTPFEH